VLEPILTSTVLRIASDASLLTASETANVVQLGENKTVALSSEQLAAMECFGVARTFESGVRALAQRLTCPGPADALTLVTDLIDQGIIGRAEKARPITPQRRDGAGFDRSGMFGCPTIALEDALSDDGPNVVFIGMPYERGVTGRSGTSTGPKYLRKCSRAAFDYTEREGAAAGWWHMGRCIRVLQGVRFRDLGDIRCQDGTANGADFDRLFETLRYLYQAGQLVILIGGDHSISLPSITAAASVHPGLGVLHFDAHSDLGAIEDMGQWRRNCTHGNFMSWVSSNPNVTSIHQFGVRHLLPDPPFSPANVFTLSSDLVASGIDIVLESLPVDRPYYITFDVDCLDPGVISQTGTPIPGGLSYQAVVKALQQLAGARRIVGIDFVELMSAGDASDYREGITVSYIMFELLVQLFASRSSNS
jgi:arginase family enzyme